MAMGRNTAYSRIDRHDQLLGLLKSSDSHKVDELAHSLNVSRRTLLRDLDLLKQRGFPIETEAGRGGGVRLYKHWGIGRLQLNYQEVIDLLLSISIMEKLNSPIFLTHLRSIKNKLFASFPGDQQTSIKKIRERLLIGELASDVVTSNYQAITHNAITQNISAAFFEQKTVEIEYCDEKKNHSKRIIEPHYLFLNWPVWYILAWDTHKEAPRCFRLDRVQKAIKGTENFRLKKAGILMGELEQYAKKL
jgi:predicted DNA-binding transcriptional regulator YafY